MKKTFNIAIDGPAGAGKSTIAKAVAARLGFVYVDTGAMYRALALYFIRRGIASNDEAAIEQALTNVHVTIRYQDGVQQVILNEENVTDSLRTEEVGNMASETSGYPFVRQKLLELQRNLAAQSDVIMDGRDIGTCVLPDADTKIFLTASSQVRAKRRYQELCSKEIMCNLQEIEQDIIQRDKRDMERVAAPLRQAEDAVCVDSSHMTIEQVIDAIIEAARSHGLESRI